MNEKIFRAYDVRGIYGTEVTDKVVQRIGKAFGSYIRTTFGSETHCGRISLGRDTRKSGPLLQSAFLKGVLSTGCSVDSYEVIPIPVLSYLAYANRQKANRQDAVAYISASHNPPEYNGVRFRTEYGHGLLYHETPMMEFYHKGDFILGTGCEIKCSSNKAVEDYAKFLEKKVELKKKLKIVLDAGNGSSCIIGPLYNKLGLDVVMVNGNMHGDFPGRGPNPTEESLRNACKMVKENNADYGVGFDADADRGVVIDNDGRVLPPEKVAIIIARHRYGPKDLVISGLDSSMILERELEKDHIKVMRVRVGDVFIANRVKNEGAVLGVERSGHFFLPEFQYSDDPFAMSLALGEIISKGETLSVLADQIKDYPYRQKSIRLKEDPLKVMTRLKIALASLEPDTTDGLKITTESYSVLIRPSNTEPILRLYIETTGTDMEELEKRFDQVIHKAMKS